MAWTTPRTWAYDETPDDAIFNQHVRDNLNFLYAAIVPIGGTLVWSGRKSAIPSTFMVKDGTAVSRATYATLFGLLTIQQSGTRTTSSAVVTGLSDTSEMVAGMPVCGTGIQSGTTILSVDSGSQITLSKTATSSGTSTVVVAPHGVGDGSTTFNLPDARGRGSWGVAASGTGARLGETGGARDHTHAYTDVPSHTHGVNLNHGGSGATPYSIGDGYVSANVVTDTVNGVVASAGVVSPTTQAANAPYLAEFHLIRVA